MNKRLAAISARLAECKKDMTTFRDPWQAVVDVEYLLRRIRRLEKPLRRWTVDQQRKDGSWHRAATAHIWQSSADAHWQKDELQRHYPNRVFAVTPYDK